MGVDEPIDHYVDISSTATTAASTNLSDSDDSCDSQSFITDESHPSNGNAQNDHDSNNDDVMVPENIECHNTYHEDKEISYMIPTPKSGQPRDLSLTPISIMVIDTIGMIKPRKLLKVLLALDQLRP